jgi:hypothetical protein
VASQRRRLWWFQSFCLWIRSNLWRRKCPKMGGIKRLGLVHVLVNAVIYVHIGTFELVYMTGRANRVPERARMLASQHGDVAMLSCTKKHNVLDNGEILWHSAA